MGRGDSAPRPTAIPSSPDGKIFVGTNNEALYDKELPGDKGVLLAFNEADGEVPVADGLRQASGRPRQ